jgi:hypothetical protein
MTTEEHNLMLGYFPEQWFDRYDAASSTFESALLQSAYSRSVWDAAGSLSSLARLKRTTFLWSQDFGHKRGMGICNPESDPLGIPGEFLDRKRSPMRSRRTSTA